MRIDSMWRHLGGFLARGGAAVLISVPLSAAAFGTAAPSKVTLSIAASPSDSASLLSHSPSASASPSPSGAASPLGAGPPGVSLDQSASPTTYDTAGQTITYSFVVTDSGATALTNVSIDDSGPSGLSAVSCPQPSLASKGSETCTAIYVTTQADTGNGNVFNTATAQGTPPAIGPIHSAGTSTTVSAVQAPGISLGMTAAPTTYDAAGQTITYSFDVTNTGNATLSGIRVNDTDLPGVSAISCPQPSLAPGGTETCTAAYVTTQANVNAGALFTMATAQGIGLSSPCDLGPTVRRCAETQDVPVVSDASSATVPAVQSPAISLVTSDSPVSYTKPGQTIRYRFDVTNTGNVTLSSISVNDKDLPGLSKVSCPVSRLAPAAADKCTATYVTTRADLAPAAISNTATAQGLWPEGGAPLVSNASSVTVALISEPGIAMAMSASPPSFTTTGQKITYSYLVTNTGNVLVTSVGVADPLPGLSAIVCPSSRLAVGAHETCTATYVITSADVAAGTVENEATARALGMCAGTMSVSRRSSVVVLVPAPIISVPVPVTG
jgi:uncharacterized repeat protein (TIGR01451 family)